MACGLSDSGEFRGTDDTFDMSRVRGRVPQFADRDDAAVAADAEQRIIRHGKARGQI
jgi:hypothetical protein